MAQTTPTPALSPCATARRVGPARSAANVRQHHLRMHPRDRPRTRLTHAHTGMQRQVRTRVRVRRRTAPSCWPPRAMHGACTCGRSRCARRLWRCAMYASEACCMPPGADMAPWRGDLASIAPASRCLPACADGNAVHLGHEDERPKLLRHARVENSLLHWPAQVFGESCAVRGDAVCGFR